MRAVAVARPASLSSETPAASANDPIGNRVVLDRRAARASAATSLSHAGHPPLSPPSVHVSVTTGRSDFYLGLLLPPRHSSIYPWEITEKWRRTCLILMHITLSPKRVKMFFSHLQDGVKALISLVGRGRKVHTILDVICLFPRSQSC